MKTVDVKISELKAADYNPRRLTEKQFEDIKASLDRFGVVEPVVVNQHPDRMNVIVGGHMRCRVLEKLGHKTVPVVYVNLPIEQEKELNVRLNKNTGEWDFDALANLFEQEDLIDWGFEESDFLGIEVLEPEETQGDDEAPGIPEIPKTALGDVYDLSGHRLMCGDSTSIDVVNRLMDGEVAHMIFTDPPYGMSYQSNMRTKSKKFDVIKNDDKIITEWIPIAGVVSEGFCFIWTTWKVLREWLDATKDFAPLTNLVVWDKGGGGIGDLEKTYSTDHELALVFNRGAQLTGKRIGSVWSVGKDSASSYEHPTQKPVALAEMALGTVTKKCDTVLDFFGGSGSTLIACEKTGRICRMMELDPKYCDVIVQRYVDFCKKNGREFAIKRNGEACNDFS